MKKLIKKSAAIVSLLTLATVPASLYFFHVAQVRGEKRFLKRQPTNTTSPIYPLEQQFAKREKETRTLVNDGLKLNAWWVPQILPTNKTVIIAHGFSSSKEEMSAYGELFYALGYNLLMPDNRGHGASEGDLIGYGMADKSDYLKWINLVIKENPLAEITLFGLSMGAATVMMTSGEQLPENVKNIIEDCGYDSVWNELNYQAKQMYHLPAFPLLYEVSAISKLRAGFFYQKASCTKALQRNKLPILFIHGQEDRFVPIKMVYQNYHATKGERQLWVVKGARHAESFIVAKDEYIGKIKAFLNKYSGETT
ncbi:MAG: alpha/beta hydrolase [Streptococcaceae bacterium]|jgi:fermentation-respiration switch protein FrsA (DUF1100 family)|nr:alpha/beta hydrolase [Streptococcaceae bacterium]